MEYYYICTVNKHYNKLSIYRAPEYNKFEFRELSVTANLEH